ncbi:hypothetical protein LTR40_013390 [Exophiala xenobiotica]|nr:hypothetical protein LTR40_013390 [Exophiala xenobiotica]
MTTPEQNGAVVPEAPLDSTQASKAKEPEMPKLSADEFRVYNRLAGMMDQYCDLSEADKDLQQHRVERHAACQALH